MLSYLEPYSDILGLLESLSDVALSYAETTKSESTESLTEDGTSEVSVPEPKEIIHFDAEQQKVIVNELSGVEPLTTFLNGIVKLINTEVIITIADKHSSSDSTQGSSNTLSTTTTSSSESESIHKRSPESSSDVEEDEKANLSEDAEIEETEQHHTTTVARYSAKEKQHFVNLIHLLILSFNQAASKPALIFNFFEKDVFLLWQQYQIVKVTPEKDIKKERELFDEIITNSDVVFEILTKIIDGNKDNRSNWGAYVATISRSVSDVFFAIVRFAGINDVMVIKKIINVIAKLNEAIFNCFLHVKSIDINTTSHVEKLAPLFVTIFTNSRLMLEYSWKLPKSSTRSEILVLISKQHTYRFNYFKFIGNEKEAAQAMQDAQLYRSQADDCDSPMRNKTTGSFSDLGSVAKLIFPKGGNARFVSRKGKKKISSNKEELSLEELKTAIVEYVQAELFRLQSWFETIKDTETVEAIKAKMVYCNDIINATAQELAIVLREVDKYYEKINLLDKEDLKDEVNTFKAAFIARKTDYLKRLRLLSLDALEVETSFLGRSRSHSHIESRLQKKGSSTDGFSFVSPRTRRKTTDLESVSTIIAGYLNTFFTVNNDGKLRMHPDAIKKFTDVITADFEVAFDEYEIDEWRKHINRLQAEYTKLQEPMLCKFISYLKGIRSLTRETLNLSELEANTTTIVVIFEAVVQILENFLEEALGDRFQKKLFLDDTPEVSLTARRSQKKEEDWREGLRIKCCNDLKEKNRTIKTNVKTAFLEKVIAKLFVFIKEHDSEKKLDLNAYLQTKVKTYLKECLPDYQKMFFMFVGGFVYSLKRLIDSETLEDVKELNPEQAYCLFLYKTLFASLEELANLRDEDEGISSDLSRFLILDKQHGDEEVVSAWTKEFVNESCTKYNKTFDMVQLYHTLITKTQDSHHTKAAISSFT